MHCTAGRKAELQERLRQAREEQGELAQLQTQEKSQYDITYEELRNHCKLRNLQSSGRKQVFVDGLTEVVCHRQEG